jgi:hypothetical protein
MDHPSNSTGCRSGDGAVGGEKCVGQAIFCWPAGIFGSRRHSLDESFVFTVRCPLRSARTAPAQAILWPTMQRAEFLRARSRCQGLTSRAARKSWRTDHRMEFFSNRKPPPPRILGTGVRPHQFPLGHLPALPHVLDTPLPGWPTRRALPQRVTAKGRGVGSAGFFMNSEITQRTRACEVRLLLQQPPPPLSAAALGAYAAGMNQCRFLHTQTIPSSGDGDRVLAPTLGQRHAFLRPQYRHRKAPKPSKLG